MIEKDYEAREKTLACDGCGELHEPGIPLDADYREFQRMTTDARLNGWAIKPDGFGGWVHWCRDCKPNGVAEQRALLNRR